MNTPIDMSSLDYEIINDFKQAYSGKNGLIKFLALTQCEGTDGIIDPDSTSLCLIRVFIEDSERLANDQKYIFSLRFVSYGDMAIIDIISLDCPEHLDILEKHLLLTGDRKKDFSDYRLELENNLIPLELAGGHLRQTNDTIEFFGDSGSFGGVLLGQNVNPMAAFIISAMGIKTPNDTQKGLAFFTKLLDFMQKHKLKPDFYEQIAVELLPLDLRIAPQKIGGLVAMKVRERALTEGVDPILATVQEMTRCGGFASEFFLIQSAKRMANLY